MAPTLVRLLLYVWLFLLFFFFFLSNEKEAMRTAEWTFISNTKVIGPSFFFPLVVCGNTHHRFSSSN